LFGQAITFVSFWFLRIIYWPVPPAGEYPRSSASRSANRRRLNRLALRERRLAGAFLGQFAVRARGNVRRRLRIPKKRLSSQTPSGGGPFRIAFSCGRPRSSADGVRPGKSIGLVEFLGCPGTVLGRTTTLASHQVCTISSNRTYLFRAELLNRRNISLGALGAVPFTITGLGCGYLIPE
jgi:hypothetical protein